MKVVVVLFALFASLALADKSCGYVSSDSKWLYDLSNVKLQDGTPYSYTNDKGTYFFNFCKDLKSFKNSDASKCPKDSAVCLMTGDKFIKLGDEEDLLFADSPFGTDKGLEMTYGSGEKCQADQTVNFKTLLRLNCSASERMTVTDIQTDACTTTIFINSLYACPAPFNGQTGQLKTSARSVVSLIFILSLACCVALCCTCCIRACRRGCRMRRCCKQQCRNGEYNAVECQTFSEETVQQQPDETPVQPMMVPQYFMMPYPAQNGQYAPPMYFVNPPVQPQEVQVSEDQQIAADEAYARQLQEQLNNQ
jgi:hypothetical protein